MAIFGIGAYYRKDVSSDFLSRGIACIGWSIEDAPTLHNILEQLRVGDIIYMKSNSPKVGLVIKAVGIVTSNKLRGYKNLGKGVKVRWLWSGKLKLGKIPELNDKYNVRNNSIYEEFNIFIQTRILELFFET